MTDTTPQDDRQHRQSDFCTSHNRRVVEQRRLDDKQDATNHKVDTQGGRLTTLIWAIGLLCVIIMATVGFMWKGQQDLAQSMRLNQEKISSNVANIDKTFTSYMAGNIAQTASIRRDILQVRDNLVDHEGRLRVLENLRKQTTAP